MRDRPGQDECGLVAGEPHARGRAPLPSTDQGRKRMLAAGLSPSRVLNRLPLCAGAGSVRTPGERIAARLLSLSAPIEFR